MVFWRALCSFVNVNAGIGTYLHIIGRTMNRDHSALKYIKVTIISDILERNNDYSDNLDFRRRWVEEVGVVIFSVLEVSDYNKSAMLIYYYYTGYSKSH